MKLSGKQIVKRVGQGIWSVAFLVIALLLCRFFVSVFQVSSQSRLSGFFCSVTDPILCPVLVILGQQPPHAARMIEFSSLTAVVFYFVIADSLSRLVFQSVRPEAT